ncbi:MAG: metallophosphoesterase [Paludibacteraceae bacterium]|nr:metallophosphoesterase [Paludibacteraceae bacterium]
MKKNIQISLGSLFLVLGSIFTACGPDARLDMVGMFAGSSPIIDKRFEQSMEYNKQAGYATIQALTDDYHVYVCTDTHIHKTRKRWEYFIDAYRADLLCPLAVHLGDIIDATTDFGYIEEALAPHPLAAILPNKTDTLMAVCGNHDIYFKQWEQYIKTFKTSSYYFVVKTPTSKKDLFVVFDSADGTVGKKQLTWLRETLAWAEKQDFRHIVACTHTNFFKRDNSQGHSSNFTQEETYALLNLFTSSGVDMLWSGHDHSREITQVNGMTSIVVDSMKDEDKEPYYMLVTMGEKIDYKFVAVP